MSNQANKLVLLRQRIARLREGQLTTQERIELKQMLRADAEARRVYARYTVLQGLLELRLGRFGRD